MAVTLGDCDHQELGEEILSAILAESESRKCLPVVFKASWFTWLKCLFHKKKVADGIPIYWTRRG